MRRFPLDPPWLNVPIVALILGAAAAVSNGSSLIVLYALALLATLCGTIGADRWLERYRPRRRRPQR